MNPGMTARRPFFCSQNIASMLDLAPKISSAIENFLPDYLAICNVSGCGELSLIT